MPNQLSIPFKKCSPVPLKQAVRDYISEHHPETHPDAFKWDLNRWEALRKDGVGGAVHVDRIALALSYHAQLVFVLTKLPPDIGLEISYTLAFSPSSRPDVLSNLAYERTSVIFNLAALYSQLAASEDRSTADGLKRATVSYQNAAGTLSYLISTALSPFQASLMPGEAVPFDLTEASARSLEQLMLAQAQECAWQRAVIDHYKNGIIAKLAARVCSLYRSALTTIEEASPAIKQIFPSDWLPHIRTKGDHFEAVAQYRKSVDDLEASRYGDELARLREAFDIAKRGFETARWGGVVPAVQQDIKSLRDVLQKNIARAERDNDLIYHQDVPSPTALPPIGEAVLAKSNIPQDLQYPRGAIGNDGIILGELLAWGATQAIDMYNVKKEDWLKNEVTERAKDLDTQGDKLLSDLSLPTSLNALESNVGLPASLLGKAQEVRLAEGPHRVQKSIEDVKTLAKRDMKILDETLDVLDHEFEEDEDFQEAHPGIRLPSKEANEELVSKAERYKQVLDQAQASDALVRQKWADWEQNIMELSLPEAQLEALVPSSTVSVGGRSGVSSQTLSHARALHVLLESLDDVRRARTQLVDRARRLAASDDIAPKIMKQAAGFEQWTEVQPAMFDDLFDQEMAKYDKFRDGVEETARKQEQILSDIKARNAAFIQSRRDDPGVNKRQHAIQTLELAYHKYKEITRNLDEGLKFYNDLAGILTQFKELCKEWTRERQNEINTHSMQGMSIQSPPADTNRAPTPPIQDQSVPSTPDPPQRQQRLALDLPPPNSDEWESEFRMPPGPRFARHGAASRTPRK
ncbi:hypothetical protein JAAARDRAFT_58624 [Jaapia argillacea MUCL 33604]|uniref:BRO1 domain-containing protein n=1 Tax=Jaapia argillacea MUCL 33604 TaxID=933084 RepID=A0A067PQR5_9AGAM|nr:hypothetical protein JAAARDRAFT_58624 [Jaapia argillacea MUCL 33604]